MNNHDQQLIDNYLANGGTIKQFEDSPEVFEPHPKPISAGQPHQYDRYGNRIYQNLNQTLFITEPDPTTFNYGD